MMQTQITKTPAVHDGPCRVALDIWIGSSGLTPRILAERAMLWTDGLDEFDDIRPLAAEALALPRGDARQMFEMSREQFDALSEIVSEFAAYASACGYAGEDDEDALIARALTSGGRVCTWLLCECPVIWTETWVERWSWGDREVSKERRAGAH